MNLENDSHNDEVKRLASELRVNRALLGLHLDEINKKTKRDTLYVRLVLVFFVLAMSFVAWTFIL